MDISPKIVYKQNLQSQKMNIFLYHSYRNHDIVNGIYYLNIYSYLNFIVEKIFLIECSHFLNISDLVKHPVFVNVIYILYNTLIVLFYHPPFQITMYQSQEIIITRGFCIVQVITHVDCDVEHRGYANCHLRTIFFLFLKWRFALLYTNIQRSVFKYVKCKFYKKIDDLDYRWFLVGCNFLLIFAIKRLLYEYCK